MTGEDRLEAIRLARTLRQAGQQQPTTTRACAPESIHHVDLRVLRDGDICYNEVTSRGNNRDVHGVARLLYAATQHLDHPRAAEMLHGCSISRMQVATCAQHLRQALQGLTLALARAQGEVRWKVMENRSLLLNIIGAYPPALRQACEWYVEVPATHSSFGMACHLIGFAAGRMRLHRMALHAYQFALAAREWTAVMHDNLCLGMVAAHLCLGELPAARSSLAHLQAPDSGPSLAMHAQLLAAEQRWGDALDCGQCALRNMRPQPLASLPPVQLADVHALLARACEELGRPEQARLHARAARYLSVTFHAVGYADSRG